MPLFEYALNAVESVTSMTYGERTAAMTDSARILPMGRDGVRCAPQGPHGL